MRSRKQKQMEMEISECQLLAMTKDLVEAHQETLPKVHDAIAEWIEGQRDLRLAATAPQPSRRLFLFGVGAAAGGLVLAACSSSSKNSVGTSATTAAGPTSSSNSGSGFTGDLAVAALAAGLENLAVAAYGAGLDAATMGKLGTVPPAVATFAQTAQSQHKDHAAAWNAIISGAGKQPVSGVDLTVKSAVVDPGFPMVKTVGDLAKFALVLENAAAATYLEGIGAMTDASNIKVAASIQPVEMQHAAILHFVLGEYPVPDSFAKMDGARPLTDQIG
jgi:hypothetical protein